MLTLEGKLGAKCKVNRYRLSLLFACLLLALIGCSRACASPANLAPLLLGQGFKPSLLADRNGQLHAFFISAAGQSKNIISINSYDNGRSFGQPVTIANLNGEDTFLSAALESDGSLDLLWSDAVNNVDGESKVFFFSRSKDSGLTWSKPSRLPVAASSPEQSRIAIADGGRLGLVWCQKEGKTGSVFYTYSKDGGNTFAPPIRINQDDQYCTAPSLTVASDGCVHIVWLGKNSSNSLTDVYYRYSSNNFDPAFEKSDVFKVSAGAKLALHPVVAAGLKGRIYIAWTDNSAREDSSDLWCVMRRGKDKFTLPVNLSNTAGLCAGASVSADQEGRVAAVWSDASYGRPHAFSRLSVDNLGDVSYAMDLSGGEKSGSVQDPSVILMRGRAYIVWAEAVEKGSERQNVIKLTSLGFKNVATGAGFDIHLKSARKLLVPVSH